MRSQRMVGHWLIGQRQTAALLEFFVKRLRWFVTANCIAVLSLSASLFRLVSAANAGYLRLAQGLLLAPCVLSAICLLDVPIVHELRHFFTLYWMGGNAFAYVVADVVLHKHEPAYLAGALMELCALCTLPVMDAFPWRIVPQWSRVRKALYAGFVVVLLTRVMSFQAEAVEVEDVVLFSAGYVQITLAELCVQCCSNVAAFATGLLFEAFVHPNSFTVWKSRLQHTVITVAVTQETKKHGTGADKSGTAQSGHQKPKGMMTENPMSFAVGTSGNAVVSFADGTPGKKAVVAAALTNKGIV